MDTMLRWIRAASPWNRSKDQLKMANSSLNKADKRKSVISQPIPVELQTYEEESNVPNAAVQTGEAVRAGEATPPPLSQRSSYNPPDTQNPSNTCLGTIEYVDIPRFQRNEPQPSPILREGSPLAYGSTPTPMPSQGIELSDRRRKMGESSPEATSGTFRPLNDSSPAHAPPSPSSYDGITIQQSGGYMMLPDAGYHADRKSFASVKDSATDGRRISDPFPYSRPTSFNTGATDQEHAPHQGPSQPTSSHRADSTESCGIHPADGCDGGGTGTAHSGLAGVSSVITKEEPPGTKEEMEACKCSLAHSLHVER